jgi:hypothetical protein
VTARTLIRVTTLSVWPPMSLEAKSALAQQYNAKWINAGDHLELRIPFHLESHVQTCAELFLAAGGMRYEVESRMKEVSS